MEAIETHYDGHKFRSRAEARWAVFFKNAGIEYEYEPQGYVLKGETYLPDFWLSGLGLWIEVKGGEPTEDEAQVCAELARQSGKRCFIAVGGPDTKNQLIHIDETGAFDATWRYYFAEDRRNYGEVWLVSCGENDLIECGWKLNDVGGEDHDKPPVIFGKMKQAYAAARSARFEHGEKPT